MLIEMDENGEAEGDISTSEKRRKQAADIKGKCSAHEQQSRNNTLRRSLQRGSSFTFLTPGPQWDFTLKRKHRQKDDGDAFSICGSDFKKSKYRQKDDSDTISICSFDFKAEEDVPAPRSEYDDHNSRHCQPQDQYVNLQQELNTLQAES